MKVAKSALSNTITILVLSKICLIACYTFCSDSELTSGLKILDKQKNASIAIEINHSEAKTDQVVITENSKQPQRLHLVNVEKIH